MASFCSLFVLSCAKANGRRRHGESLFPRPAGAGPCSGGGRSAACGRAKRRKRFRVSVPSIVRWRALEREGRGVGPKPFAGGRRPARTEAARETILALLRENPASPPKRSARRWRRAASSSATARSTASAGATARCRGPPAAGSRSRRRGRRFFALLRGNPGLRDPRPARRPGGTRPRCRLRRALPVPRQARLQGRRMRAAGGNRLRAAKPPAPGRLADDLRQARIVAAVGGGDVLFGGGQAVPRQPGHHRPLARAAALKGCRMERVGTPRGR